MQKIEKNEKRTIRKNCVCRKVAKSRTYCGKPSCINTPANVQKEIVCKEIEKIRSSPPKETSTIQMMNIVSAKWWRKWTDFTSFEGNIGLNIFMKDMFERTDRIASISFEEETSMISSH